LNIYNKVLQKSRCIYTPAFLLEEWRVKILFQARYLPTFRLPGKQRVFGPLTTKAAGKKQDFAVVYLMEGY